MDLPLTNQRGDLQILTLAELEMVPQLMHFVAQQNIHAINNCRGLILGTDRDAFMLYEKADDHYGGQILVG